ncbi:MAG: CDP-diacylglycerol--serine O-phosphatidyltransferase [Pirellulales bacterium]
MLRTHPEHDPQAVDASRAPDKRTRRRLRSIAMLPTLFTLGNLVCGFFAIVVAARVMKPDAAVTTPASPIDFGSFAFDPTDPAHNFMLSGWLIFFAMIFDALDGHVARLTRTAGNFGAQLDSLCDLVTFGVAPGFLLVKMVPAFTFSHPQTIWIIAVIFPICAAVRLARFNVETNENDDHSKFSGLPSPAAAATIAGFAILFYTLRVDYGNERSVWIDGMMQYAVPFVALAVAVLMVSRIPYPHLVNRLFRGRKGFGHFVGILFGLLLLAIIPGYIVPALSLLFVFGPPVLFAIRRVRSPEPSTESLF